jgi:hypothetical protein
MYATFFYSKNTGKIKSYCVTETPQDLNYFGEDKVDYELIYDFLVFEYSEEIEIIIRNRDIFIVNLDNKEIVQKNIVLDIKSM